MPTQGYIRDELDLRVLILCSLWQLNMPVSKESLYVVASCDDCVQFFEFADALHELTTGGLAKTAEDEQGREVYTITPKGRDVMETYRGRLPGSVHANIRREAMRLRGRLRRDACIRFETVFDSDRPNHIVERMFLSDGQDELMRLDISVVNREQAMLLESNFKENAETIYKKVLSALLLEE